MFYSTRTFANAIRHGSKNPLHSSLIAVQDVLINNVDFQM